MSQNLGFNRRAFLRNAGLTALVSAVGRGSSSASSLDFAALSGDEPAAAAGKFDFDTPYSRIGTDSVKWDQAMRTNGVDHLVAGMGIADMDFRAAPVITKALMDRMQHENWGYLDMPQSFSKGIIAWNKKRYGVTIDPDLLGITTGVHPGLIAALRVFSPPGSKVLLLTPTYNGFYGDLTYTHTVPEESLMTYSNGRFAINFEDLERRMSADTKTLILCNPQNPTGNCWSRQDLTTLGAMCLKHKVVVLSDEIHCDFVNRGETFTPFSTLDNHDIVNNSISFKAASKSFGLAAMKCAWFFTTNKDYFAAVKAMNRADLTTVGMIASEAAYAGGEEWLNQCVAYIDGNHEFVQSYINANIPMIKIGAKAQGTYLTWIDVSQVSKKIGAKEQAAEESKKQAPGMKPITPEQIVEKWFAKHAFVALNPGHTYGLGGADHMRMNIATSRKTLQAALASMATALKNA
ncbi:MAG TPA: aminotransferase class I/II-fold pyridoxal phosphate-dependent enzyme [Vicinamibacterales bacterium]|jgi:cystathionine beta-lyase|nr:aminotransferase class I/II-fold pyridoxal phosphate-dependent enzyme [Vicinamibacterales bacterium]